MEIHARLVVSIDKLMVDRAEETMDHIPYISREAELDHWTVNEAWVDSFAHCKFLYLDNSQNLSRSLSNSTPIPVE